MESVKILASIAILGVTLAWPTGTALRPSPREAPARIASTATVSGRLVIGDSTARPARRALVRLSGTGLLMSRVSITDDEGRFAFDSLPAGQFTLVASKAGYVTTFYGSLRPGRGPGMAIALGDGQRLDDLKVALLPGAVITGTITDERGRRWPGLPVSILTVGPIRGGRLPVPSRLVETDDRGVYRAFGLSPGTYLVAASATGSGYAGAAPLSEADFQRAMSLVQSTGPSPRKAMGYAPVLYPGTADPSQAVQISLGPGEERGGIDFRLVLTPTARISGAVTPPDGWRMQNLHVGLVSAAERLGFGQLQTVHGIQAASTVVARNGQFTRGPLAPGRYTFFARADGYLQNSGGLPNGATENPTSNVVLWATAEVDLDGADLTTALKLTPGATVVGRATLAGAEPSSAGSFGSYQIRLVAVDRDELHLAVPPARLGADGQFKIVGIVPGRYWIEAAAVSGAQPTWMLRSATVGGADALDTPIQIGPDGTTGGDVQLVFTDQSPVLSGQLLDVLGRPAPEYRIVLCSTNEGFWTTHSRRTRQTQPDSSGQYTIRGIPPGEYFVAAVTDLEDGDLDDPDFLKSLAASAVRVVVVDGEPKHLDLRIAGRSGG